MRDPEAPALAEAPDDPDASELRDDIDLALRTLSQHLPEDLARALLPTARRLTDCAWGETQLAARQRRMDRSLFVVADGVARVEHLEWQTRWERAVPFRVFEYNALQTIALRESSADGRWPRVESTVVLLGGREAPWPERLAFRTSPRGAPFSGVRFRVDAVYQRSLRALADRGSVFWMAFAPLATDASPALMPAVVRELRARATPAQFDEVAVAMSVLAGADSRRRGLADTITTLLPKELVMRSNIYNMGLAAGLEKGIERGIEKGLEKGIERGIEKGIVDGERMALRQAIELTLSTRRLRLTASKRARLQAETRLDVLRAWLTRAITADRAADVFADP
jgi:hypothetical protein